MLKTIFSEVGLKFEEEKVSTEYVKVLLPMMFARQLLAYYLSTHLGNHSTGDY